MLRDLLSLAYGSALALVVGIASAVWATDHLPFFGVLKIGDWTAYPSVGRSDPDPYTRAYLARTGALPLATAEGVAFEMHADSDGRPLNAACSYRIAGTTPTARRWTLRIERGGIAFDAGNPALPVALHSRGLLHDTDGDFEIGVSPVPVPGNWLYTGPDGPFSLILTLYDTTIASDVGLTKLTMPEVKFEGCGNV